MELLNRIQKELKAPKGQLNTFGGYKYRNCEDILEAVKPLLGDGVLTLSDEIVQLGDRYYVKATVTLSNGEANPAKKEAVSATAWAREAIIKKGMDEAQITGAASSYARKYALNGLFCIDDTKDADSSDNTDNPAPAKPAAKPAPKAWDKTLDDKKKARIKKLCDDKALAPLLSKAEYHRYIKENTSLDMAPENFDEIITRLEAIQ
jgi:hypothetical protein